jgi:succinoglycan biosynthesis protein ExoL
MQNNRVALPNKLYEAMYFRVPIVASKGTYLAERVLDAGIGYAIDCGDVAQIRAVLHVHAQNASGLDAAFERLPPQSYFADGDYEQFASLVVDGLSPQ